MPLIPPARRPAMSAAGITATVVGICLALSGCAGGGANAAPTWVPQPDFQANAEPQPQVPGNALPAPSPSSPSGTGVQPSAPATGGQSPGNPSTSPSSAVDPAVVATKLNQPTGIAVLPDGTALVGERTTGRILRVQPQAGQPVTLVQTIAGLSTVGGGGLLDLALSPSFAEDGLVYAYVTTGSDNRVLHFSVGGTPTPVLTGIPRGSTHNAGRIAFDATGALLIGTSDAGRPALAADPASLAGKVLRTTDLGQPAPNNPDPKSLVYASGFSTVDGLCVDHQSGMRAVVSAGNTDRVNILHAGTNYQSAAATSLPPKFAGAGGCALVQDRIVVATSTGMSLVSATLSATTSAADFTATLTKKYGRLRTVIAGADGAFWITTTNRDGLGRPIATDDRVIRVSIADGGGSSPV
ncbi:PQQ-dependent sugar dehydrogenase [Jatrophihabitans telluris]|uniref:PQQ-dependent sugar dehydrogenase n=1 Tax=Jatrophihabitans telluris TaxID=2038343 RepID=A0ABY4R3Z3_9ACTN|nr:PQQ-dependent sugar dehydrogenase [Jatrophihabitans telluris]UQX89937.1 PQQ-dependent sugar dehydrogenase [Jatrophihabitans telluris]